MVSSCFLRVGIAVMLFTRLDDNTGVNIKPCVIELASAWLSVYVKCEILRHGPPHYLHLYLHRQHVPTSQFNCAHQIGYGK